MWQHVRIQDNIWQNIGDLLPFYEDPVCPDPVWKPVKKRKRHTPARSRGVGMGQSQNVVLSMIVELKKIIGLEPLLTATAREDDPHSHCP